MHILAVDISNLFRRNWEASRGKEFSEAHNRTVQAVARFREGHDRVAICCDGGKSFRKALSPQYKADRTDPGEAYREQLRRTIDRLRADGCSVFTPPQLDDQGFAEADDIIGSLCAWAREFGHSVSILSADKDILQCVTSKDADPKVCRITPDKGDVQFAETVKDLVGIEAIQINEWLALCGDKSDGYKPYPGLGEKGAAKLLQVRGSIANVLCHTEADQLGELLKDRPLGLKIKELGPDPGFQALKLATLRCDLPIDFSVLEADPVVKPLTDKPTQPPPGKGGQDLPVPAPSAAPAAVQSPPEPTPAPSPPAGPVATTGPNSTALALRALDPFALEPKNPKAAWWLAEVAFNSRCFGQKFPSVDAAYIAILEGRALGMSAIVSLKNAYVVKNNIGWSARCLRGQCLKHPTCEYFDVAYDDEGKTATAIYKRRGRPEYRHTVTLAEAEERGFIKEAGVNRFGKETEANKWRTDPKPMLIACAEREAARMGWPDVVAGLWTPEELRMMHAGQLDTLDAEIVESEAA